MDWGHWASLMFEVAEIEPSSDKHAATMRFGRGGFQGAQGGNASNYYLENIKELLDDTHEFYYDAPSHTLFFSQTRPHRHLRQTCASSRRYCRR